MRQATEPTEATERRLNSKMKKRIRLDSFAVLRGRSVVSVVKDSYLFYLANVKPLQTEIIRGLPVTCKRRRGLYPFTESCLLDS